MYFGTAFNMSSLEVKGITIERVTCDGGSVFGHVTEEENAIARADHAHVQVILPDRFPDLWAHIDGDNLLADFLAREEANDTPIKKVLGGVVQMAENLANTLDPIASKADEFVQQKLEGSTIKRMGQLPPEQNNEILKHTLLKPKRWFSVKRGLGKKEEAEVKEQKEE